jgi:hypothetical protein
MWSKPAIVSLDISPPSLSAREKSMNRNSLLCSILIYHHPQFATTNFIKQAVVLCQGLTLCLFSIF